jgi:hypothetical protein
VAFLGGCWLNCASTNFSKTKILENLGSLGEEFYKGKRKREPGQRVECTLFYFILFYFIFNRLISQLWRFLPKF